MLVSYAGLHPNCGGTTDVLCRTEGPRLGEAEREAGLGLLSAAALELSPGLRGERGLREQGHMVRVMEALGAGVSFTSLERSAVCDSLAVFRPRLPNTGNAQALLRAFDYARRPYDCNFDFSTDARLVCTELVDKACEPKAGRKGLTLPLIGMLGRKVTPAKEPAKQFDAQYKTDAQ